jgi:hypothetical protein
VRGAPTTVRVCQPNQRRCGASPGGEAGDGGGEV